MNTCAKTSTKCHNVTMDILPSTEIAHFYDMHWTSLAFFCWTHDILLCVHCHGVHLKRYGNHVDNETLDIHKWILICCRTTFADFADTWWCKKRCWLSFLSQQHGTANDHCLPWLLCIDDSSSRSNIARILWKRSSSLNSLSFIELNLAHAPLLLRLHLFWMRTVLFAVIRPSKTLLDDIFVWFVVKLHDHVNDETLDSFTNGSSLVATPHLELLTSNVSWKSGFARLSMWVVNQWCLSA